MLTVATVVVRITMDSKDLFHEIDLFSLKRMLEPSTPIMPTLTRENCKRLDDSFLETFHTRQQVDLTKARLAYCIWHYRNSSEREC